MVKHTVQPIPDEYRIPKNKKALLTDDFLIAFKQELESKYRVELEDNTYGNFYTQIMSTLGFYQALESVCKRFNIKEELYDYAVSLEWYHSDEFDSELVKLMFEQGIIEK